MLVTFLDTRSRTYWEFHGSMRYVLSACRAVQLYIYIPHTCMNSSDRGWISYGGSNRLYDGK